MTRTRAATRVALLGLTCLAGAAAAAPGAQDEIRGATATLLEAGSRPHGDVHAALRSLLDVAAGLGREARLAAPAQAKLDSAAAQAHRLSPLDDAVRASVSEAYAALDGGRPFVFPKEVRTIEQARAYGRGQADRGLAAASAGRPKEAAQELLGLVLLVITPMEAPR